jgi:hypothetical protein
MRFSTLPDKPKVLNLRGRAYQHLAAAIDRVPLLGAPSPYNLTVSDDPPFVWYRVAKVGTRTIHRHLAAHAALRLNHPYQVRLPRAGHRGHFHFAFVRNPWDRLVSCWQDKVLARDYFALGPGRPEIRRLPEFLEYVARLDLDKCDPHLRRQTALIDLDRVDFIGRFERFEDDFATVCRRLGIPETFGHHNPTDHEEYSVYYDDGTAETVGRLYEPDVRLFGYRFEPLGVVHGAGDRR